MKKKEAFMCWRGTSLWVYPAKVQENVFAAKENTNKT
jgi:hypothetical protein